MKVYYQMNDKFLLEQRFNKSLSTYKDNAIVQNYMAKKLLNMIEKKKYCDVFEFGCGCGLLTNEFFKNFQCGNYLANDIVQSCSEYLSKISQKIVFNCCDIEKMKLDRNFDLIISNATFQWLQNPKTTVENFIAHLKPNGTLAFTTFGINNFKELKKLGYGIDYLKIKDLENLFKDYKKNLIIKEEIKTLYFKTPYDVLKHIKFSGVNAVSKISLTKSKLNDFSSGYNKYFKTNDDNFVTLTYHPIYIIFQM